MSILTPCVPTNTSKETRSEVIRKGKSAPLNDNSGPLSPVRLDESN